MTKLVFKQRNMRRVVITGMGIWSCIGTSIEEVKESLYNGKSGIGIEEERLRYGYQSGLTGIVPKPQLKGLIDRHLRRGMSEEAEYAYMAGRQAFEMAGVDEEYLLNNEVGCIFGNDSSAKPVIETAKLMEEKHDTELLGQSYIFQSMNSTINMNLSTIFHLKGVNFSVSAACASGSHSIGLGYMLIKQGLQDMVLWEADRRPISTVWLPSMRSGRSPKIWRSLQKPAGLSTGTGMDWFPAAEVLPLCLRITTTPWHEERISLQRCWATDSLPTAPRA